jgi:hypothetical protein
MLSATDIIKVALKVFLSFNYRASGVIFSIIVPQSVSAMEKCINSLRVLLAYMYVKYSACPGKELNLLRSCVCRCIQVLTE